MFEIIISISQDIGNVLSFVKLGTLHPSIIETTNLLNQLKLREAKFDINQVLRD